MQVKTAVFLRGITGSDGMLDKDIPQIAFIGRSNVGKSSVINSLTNKKGLAITSSFPGRTKQINIFLINNAFYLLDLPGYGYAKASHGTRDQLFRLIDWYLFKSEYRQKKVVLIIDANVGPTDDDLEMLHTLEDFQKDVVVVANKIDKIKKSKYIGRLHEIKDAIGQHKIIPYSSHEKIGINALANEIFNS